MALSSSQLRTKKVAVETSDLFGGVNHDSLRGRKTKKQIPPPKKEDFNQMAQMSISQL